MVVEQGRRSKIEDLDRQFPEDEGLLLELQAHGVDEQSLLHT